MLLLVLSCIFFIVLLFICCMSKGLSLWSCSESFPFCSSGAVVSVAVTIVDVILLLFPVSNALLSFYNSSFSFALEFVVVISLLIPASIFCCLWWRSFDESSPSFFTLWIGTLLLYSWIQIGFSLVVVINFSTGVDSVSESITIIVIFLFCSVGFVSWSPGKVSSIEVFDCPLLVALTVSFLLIVFVLLLS